MKRFPKAMNSAWNVPTPFNIWGFHLASRFVPQLKKVILFPFNATYIHKQHVVFQWVTA